VQLALKVDVDTLRGTQEGVPALLRLFDKFQVRATFLFSLGPDHTGRALKRVFRPGFLAKVSRTSVTSHYGLKTLLYGTLLPGPHIGKRCASIMRSVSAAGHEVGIHSYDHVKWQDYVAKKDKSWTEHELVRAMETFESIFKTPAKTHGAAGWQINPETIALEECLGFDYASDVRGESAFYPEFNGIKSRCVQIPTTLPTLDELIGADGITEENVDQTVFKLSQKKLLNGHVYTLHAELEGMKLKPIMQRLLERWQAEKIHLIATEDIYHSLDLDQLPTCQIKMAELEGRSGTLAIQDIK